MGHRNRHKISWKWKSVCLSLYAEILIYILKFISDAQPIIYKSRITLVPIGTKLKYCFKYYCIKIHDIIGFAGGKK